jgi:hypothetical protein
LGTDTPWRPRERIDKAIVNILLSVLTSQLYFYIFGAGRLASPGGALRKIAAGRITWQTVFLHAGHEKNSFG